MLKKEFLKFGISKSGFDPFIPCHVSNDTNTQQYTGIQSVRRHCLANNSKILSLGI